jgi:electron transfer flavoprotein alpha subunit
MKNNILVIAEHWKGEPTGVTLQMLTKGRELADAGGVGLAILVLGHGIDDVVGGLKEKGMDVIWVLDHPPLAGVGGDVEAHAIAEAVGVIDPGLVLIGYSLVGMELAPAIAVKLGVAAMTNCVDVEIEDGAVVVTRPFFDGTQHAKIVLDGKGPHLVALQGGATPTVELDATDVAVRPVTLDLSAVPARGELLEVIEEAPGDVDITKAEIIVAIGRGIGAKDNIPVIEELARALGGLMACSRPLVDLGWLGRERQVGASGKSVAPKVYLACGISGASQHLEGMSESRLIVAINKDPDAPIFQLAHYGVVGDILEIVPALTEEARKDTG